MKYIVRTILIFLYIISIFSKTVLATDTNILSSQQDELNISSFIKETEKYTKEVLEDENISDIFNSALIGKIDNEKLLSKILGIFGKEIKEAITILRKCISNNYNT